MGYKNSEMGKAAEFVTAEVSPRERDPQLNAENSASSAPSATSSPLNSEEDPCDECCGDSNELHGRTPRRNASKGERGDSSNRCGSDSSGNSALQRVDSLDTEWTDEKHSSYLASIEASFLRKMYAKQYRAFDLCGQAPKEMESSDADTAQSRPKFPSLFDELNVWRESCSQKPTLNRVQCVAVPAVMGSPWTQRFRAPASSKQEAGRLSSVRKSCSNCEEKEVTYLEQCSGLQGANSREVPDLDRAIHIWRHRLQSNCSGSTNLWGKRERYDIYAIKSCIPTDIATNWNFRQEANVERIHRMLSKKQKQSVEGSYSLPNDQAVAMWKGLRTNLTSFSKIARINRGTKAIWLEIPSCKG